MKKYMLLYNGPATQPEKMDKEEMGKIMDQWKAWYKKAGDAIVDMGAPMANGMALKDDGTPGKPTLLSGYTVVQVEDKDELHELVKDHPFLSDNDGKFMVEAFELTQMPGM